MENTASLRRNHTKRGNKENTHPAPQIKSLIKRDKPSLPPFQTKVSKKEVLAANEPVKTKLRPVGVRPGTNEAPKKVEIVPRTGKEAAAASGLQRRQSHSQAFLSDQAAKQKKTTSEAQKPPTAALPSSRSAPGLYKGKVIQSKIGSIWKSSSTVAATDAKSSAPKTETQRSRNVTQIRSKSVSEVSGRGPQKPPPSRSQSVLDKTSRQPPAGLHRTRPPTRTLPATLAATRSWKATVVPTKATGSSKPKVPVTDKKCNKPPVSSSLSQYRNTTETAEEKRAKLAEWLASKGRTLKRPAMTAAAGPSKTKTTSKPAADPKPQSRSEVELQPPAQIQPAPQPQPLPGLDARSRSPLVMNSTLEVVEISDVDLPGVDDIVVNLCNVLDAMSTPSDSRDEGQSKVRKECNDAELECCQVGELKNEKPEDGAEDVMEEQKVEREELTALSKTPLVMNITLDLLETSADSPAGSQDGGEDIVVNLCEALEAMTTPSLCNDAGTEEGKDVQTEDRKPVEERKKEEEVSEGAEESDDRKVETEDEEDVECDEGLKTPPKMEEASVIKYSVKTTPYLQSVKKTLEEEVSASSSRRKSNIKDLKFLTPVRRSCRIERKSSRLPAMLAEHDPCVTSLAELDDANAYIYRKNTALLEDLPDQL